MSIYSYFSHPADEPDPLGMEDGQTCNRHPEPDEDQPRNFRPKPCKGTMVYLIADEVNECDQCGELA